MLLLSLLHPPASALTPFVGVALGVVLGLGAPVVWAMATKNDAPAASQARADVPLSAGSRVRAEIAMPPADASDDTLDAPPASQGAPSLVVRRTADQASRSASQAAVVAPRRAAAKAGGASGSSDALVQDNALLADMLGALERGDASEVLRLARIHARRFPDSPQTDVRAALRIGALCKRGETQRARAEVRAFLDVHADSPVAERVRSTCGGP